MLEHYYAVIMAGGGGTRLWPLSRQSKPKQMLRLVEDNSLFQGAIIRLEGIFPPDHIYVVTVQDQAEQLQEQCPGIPVENFILEPAARGTASVVGLAAVIIQRVDPQAVMAVLTADHYIGNIERYHHLLRAAYEAALENYLVTLGVTPTFPATGYGYIQQGEQLGTFQQLGVYRVLRFKEKPDVVQARAMLAGGDHAWNSGMFVWRVKNILAEFERQMPELNRGLSQIGMALGKPEGDRVLNQVWLGLETQTIDYGIMEGARNVVVIPAPGLEWNDVGSWDSLFDILPTDENGNIILGGLHKGLDTKNSLFYLTQEHRLIVTMDVEDLILIDTGDVLLVCHRDQAQRVRQVVQQLRRENPNYL